MDRTAACGAADVGSIPTGGTNIKTRSTARFYVGAGKTVSCMRENAAGEHVNSIMILLQNALVVQWIEYLPPKEVMQVRFLPRALK